MQYQLAYDPKIIGNVLLTTQNEVAQWALWSRVQCPILLLHASLSDVLTYETVVKMQELQINLTTVSLPGIDHPVSLMKRDEINFVKDWLIRDQ